MLHWHLCVFVCLAYPKFMYLFRHRGRRVTFQPRWKHLSFLWSNGGACGWFMWMFALSLSRWPNPSWRGPRSLCVNAACCLYLSGESVLLPPLIVTNSMCSENMPVTASERWWWRACWGCCVGGVPTIDGVITSSMLLFLWTETLKSTNFSAAAWQRLCYLSVLWRKSIKIPLCFCFHSSNVFSPT